MEAVDRLYLRIFLFLLILQLVLIILYSTIMWIHYAMDGSEVLFWDLLDLSGWFNFKNKICRQNPLSMLTISVVY